MYRTRRVKTPHPQPIFWVSRMEAFVRRYGITIVPFVEV